MMKPETRLFTSSLVCAAVTTILSGNVYAGTILNVSPTGNDFRGNYENDCTNPERPCETIGHAIYRSAVNDTISLAGGVYPENDLVISHELTIQGSDSNSIPTIDAEKLNRHFDIATAGAVVIQDLNLINGNISDVHEAGGSVKVSQGSLHFDNVTAGFNSTASDGGAVACVLDCEELHLRHSTFESNSAKHGGAVMTIGNTDVDASQFLNNEAESLGGAIHKYSKQTNFTALITDNTQFTDNSAENGGALYSATSYTQVANSSFVGNTSGNSGSAIYFFAADHDDQPLVMVSSTITRNSAGTDQVGSGAIYMNQSPGYWTNLAFVDNDSFDHGRHVDAFASTIEMSNSYLYTSKVKQSSECNSDIEMIGVDNLWDDPNSNCFDPNSYINSLSPNSLSPLGLFGPLGSLDGETLSYLLAENSNALDAAGNCYHPTAFVQLSVDQRGASRGSFCDIGPTEQGRVVVFDFDGFDPSIALDD